jgi:hypothetical protein
VGREPRVGAAQVLADRDAVHQYQAVDGVGMVQHEPHRDIAPAVVTDEVEARHTEAAHGVEDITGRRSFAVRRMVRRRRGPARSTVPPHIRAQHTEPGPDQLRCDAMPGRRGARVPVQQHDGRPLAGMPDEHRGVAEIHDVLFEALEHTPTVLQHPIRARTEAGAVFPPGRIESWILPS